MKASRALNALVAKHVFNVTPIKGGCLCNMRQSCSACDGRDGIESYSTDIDAAWSILPRMHELGHPWVIEQGDGMDFPTVHILPKHPSGEYPDATLFIDEMEKISKAANSVPLAICVTALKALGIEIPE